MAYGLKRDVFDRLDAAKAKSDLSRYTLLIKNEEVSQQEFDQVAATAKAQDATVDANTARVGRARFESAVAFHR